MSSKFMNTPLAKGVPLLKAKRAIDQVLSRLVIPDWIMIEWEGDILQESGVLAIMIETGDEKPCWIRLALSRQGRFSVFSERSRWMLMKHRGRVEEAEQIVIKILLEARIREYEAKKK